MQIVQFAGYTYKQFSTNNCMLNNSRMLSSEVPSLFRDNLVRFRDSILLFLLFLHSLGLTLPPMVPPDLQRTFHILAEGLKIKFRSKARTRNPYDSNCLLFAERHLSDAF